MAVVQTLAATVILVHGAFADGSSWDKVVSILQGKGINVVAVQNPTTSLADDVAVTRRAIAQVHGPVVLVGHSWGGAVITEAGTDAAVKSLVYVAAFAPEAGSSVNDLGKGAPPPLWLSKLIVDEQGFAALSYDGVVQYFAQDLPRRDQHVLTATQGTTAVRAFDDKLTQTAWKEKPTWYVVATHDHMINPLAERAWAHQMKAHTVELPTSHLPMLSKPKEVARVIEDAAVAAMKVAAN